MYQFKSSQIQECNFFQTNIKHLRTPPKIRYTKITNKLIKKLTRTNQQRIHIQAASLHSNTNHHTFVVYKHWIRDTHRIRDIQQTSRNTIIHHKLTKFNKFPTHTHTSPFSQQCHTFTNPQFIQTHYIQKRREEGVIMWCINNSPTYTYTYTHKKDRTFLPRM